MKATWISLDELRNLILQMDGRGIELNTTVTSDTKPIAFHSNCYEPVVLCVLSITVLFLKNIYEVLRFLLHMLRTLWYQNLKLFTCPNVQIFMIFFVIICCYLDFWSIPWQKICHNSRTKFKFAMKFRRETSLVKRTVVT